MSIETGAQRQNRPSLSVDQWQLFIDQNSSKYSVFYSVKLKDHYKHDEGHFLFEFSIISLLSDDRYDIQKRYSQFEDIEKEMKSHKLFKIKLPVLPTKRLAHTDANMMKRHSQLADWMSILLNERMYHCPLLFKFAGISETDQYLITKVEELAQKIDVKICVPEHISVNQAEENFIVFNIRVIVSDVKTRDKIDDYKVGRRFREFDCLNSILQRKFEKFKADLPSLPPKMAPFTSSIARQKSLDAYLNGLMQMKDILEVIAFRKFIGLESRTIKPGVDDLFYR